jgi:hypothetical protein
MSKGIKVKCRYVWKTHRAGTFIPSVEEELGVKDGFIYWQYLFCETCGNEILRVKKQMLDDYAKSHQ